MFRLLKKYFSINKLERKTLNQLFFWLICATILARFIPLKWFNNVLGEFKKELKYELNSEQRNVLWVLRKNLKRIKNTLPWKVKCFEESIAAKKVLEKYNVSSTIYLGVNKNSKEELIAHAWLKVGTEIFSGQKAVSKFNVVGFYS